MAAPISDPTFYASPHDAAVAPAESLAYVAAFDRSARRPDAIAVVDVDAESPSYGSVVGWTELTHLGDELHHFGWNACSSSLCPDSHHQNAERRYLVVPGLRSSRIYFLDTKGDPANPQIVRTVEPDEIGGKSGYSRPHTVHCGPGGLFVTMLGTADGTTDGTAENSGTAETATNAAANAGTTDGDGLGTDGPGGIALLDCDTFDVLGPWEVNHGPQYLAYDAWWHINHDVMITSEWGTPSMIEDGVNADLLLGRKYGHALHFWDLADHRHLQRVDLGDEHQMVLEIRPAHDPTRTYGFVGVVVSVEDLSASVWLWHRDEATREFAVEKVITIPAEPADEGALPPVIAPFGAVPPLVTDIDLSVDDHYLYVSCWGTGELKRYDVTDPAHPVEAGSVRIGGIVGRVPHPAAPGLPLSGGPQMVEVSRDGRRVYVTNSLYGAWDDQFYPDGVGAWMAKLDSTEDDTEGGTGGGFAFDERFFPHGDDFRGLRPHQTRLQGGDASSDSYCFPS